MLASLNVSKDVCAQIQRHRCGGVQDRRYDFHKYMDEKRSERQKLACHEGKLKAAHAAQAMREKQ